MNLLIVDDSEIIREAIEEWVKPLHLNVVGLACNGREALELYRETLPDMVTLDITMPEIDGITALDLMLKINPSAKIIIISALAAKEVALTALKKGAASFLVKPFTRDELEEVFREVLEEV